MGISRRNRRTLRIDDDEYVWWVQEDEDLVEVPSNGYSLRVIRNDRRYQLTYPLGQAQPTRHLVVEGSWFRGRDIGGPWRRYFCPAFCPVESVKLSDVAALINWATTGTGEVAECDYRGAPT